MDKKSVKVQKMFETGEKVVGALAFFKYAMLFLAVVSGVGASLYFGYFDHRQQVNKELAKAYEAVQQSQIMVLNIALETIPSRRTNDQMPSRENVDRLLNALTILSGDISSVETNSSYVREASAEYQESISRFSKMVVRLNANNPQSYSDLQNSADQWDKAAKIYKNALDRRINSFFATLWPSA
ncbi:MAG: hypothetical protein HWE34_12510 [Methylocystaceae bacterium]|nr:hypothetical protein [Methylocystaceae bacterium]